MIFTRWILLTFLVAASPVPALPESESDLLLRSALPAGLRSEEPMHVPWAHARPIAAGSAGLGSFIDRFRAALEARALDRVMSLYAGNDITNAEWKTLTAGWRQILTADSSGVVTLIGKSTMLNHWRDYVRQVTDRDVSGFIRVTIGKRIVEIVPILEIDGEYVLIPSRPILQRAAADPGVPWRASSLR